MRTEVGEAVRWWNLDASVFGRSDDLARFEFTANAHLTTGRDDFVASIGSTTSI